jgi:acyl-CoA thioesterase-1
MPFGAGTRGPKWTPFFLIIGALILASGPALAAPLRITAFGDSLTAGYGLPPQDGFVPRLQAALKGEGLDVTVANAGVSGDTTSDGVARLDWTLADRPDILIVELGANDGLRGVPPAVTRGNLDRILKTATGRGVRVVLAGMLAPPNLGPDYGTAFNRLYPELAAAYHVPFYPFFLDGVVLERKLKQDDDMHPNAAGVDVIVSRLLPLLTRVVRQAQQQG